MLPRYENHVSLSAKIKDKWGIPALRIECEYTQQEIDGAHMWAEDIVRLLSSVGYRTESFDGQLNEPGMSIHEMGTARMGRDRQHSVLNPYCRSWEVSNLFVTDGSSFVNSSYHNPTLTMLALTDRACGFISDRYASDYAQGVSAFS